MSVHLVVTAPRQSGHERDRCCTLACVDDAGPAFDSRCRLRRQATLVVIRIRHQSRGIRFRLHAAWCRAGWLRTVNKSAAHETERNWATQRDVLDRFYAIDLDADLSAARTMLAPFFAHLPTIGFIVNSAQRATRRRRSRAPRASADHPATDARSCDRMKPCCRQNAGAAPGAARSDAMGRRIRKWRAPGNLTRRRPTGKRGAELSRQSSQPSAVRSALT